MLGKIFLLVVGLSLSQCDDWRVANGRAATLGQYPFSVHIGYGSCSASIINENTILTAGHCVCNRPAHVVVGTIKIDYNHYSNPGTLTYPVTNVIIHPNYANKCGIVDAYDIAIIKLGRRITYTSNVQPIEVDCANIPVGTAITHIGYGRDENGASGTLKFGAAAVSAFYGQQMISQSRPSHVLPGDSGGPVIRVLNGRNVQVAVNSGIALGANPPQSYYAPTAIACAFINANKG